MSEIFEVLMVVCFGISWPISILKSWRSKSTKGKSLMFECFIWVGYAFGIISKIASQNTSYVVIFYAINLLTVSIDIGLYFRNLKLEMQNG